MLGGTYGRTVIVIAGKGNNGNDGRVGGARARRRAACAVRVFDAADCPPRAARRRPRDRRRVRHRLPRHVAGAATSATRPVLAVDIPSGVDGLTGEAARGVLAADRTVTFAALKPGLLLAAGRDLAGEVEVADIGLDTAPGAAPTSSRPPTSRRGGDRGRRPRTSGRGRSASSPAAPA